MCLLLMGDGVVNFSCDKVKGAEQLFKKSKDVEEVEEILLPT
jgi:hypothetical protein